MVVSHCIFLDRLWSCVHVHVWAHARMYVVGSCIRSYRPTTFSFFLIVINVLVSLEISKDTQFRSCNALYKVPWQDVLKSIKGMVERNVHQQTFWDGQPPGTSPVTFGPQIKRNWEQAAPPLTWYDIVSTGGELQLASAASTCECTSEWPGKWDGDKGLPFTYIVPLGYKWSDVKGMALQDGWYTYWLECMLIRVT